MAVNHVTINGETVVDLRADTVTEENLPVGVTAHNAAGDPIQGAFQPVTSVNGQTGAVVLGSTTVSVTLLAANWDTSGDRPKYTVSHPLITATSNQEVIEPVDPTDDVLEALAAASFHDGGQAAGEMYILAYGDVPTIDIPVRVIMRGVF